MSILTDPSGFFRQNPRASSLTWSGGVVTLSAIIGLTTTVVLVRQMLPGLSESAQTLALIGYAISVGSSVIGSFFLWFVYAGVFYTISIYFEGVGEFRRLFTYVGWGFIPEIVSGLMTTATMVVVVRDMQRPSSVAELERSTRAIQSHPLMTAVGIAGILLTLWRGTIWVFAVKHARNLSLRDATVTVGVPIAVSIGYTAYNLL